MAIFAIKIIISYMIIIIAGIIISTLIIWSIVMFICISLIKV